MGADLLIQSIGMKAKDGRLDEEWAKAEFAKTRQAIAAVDDAGLAEANSMDGDSYANLDDYKETLSDDLAAVESAAFGNQRSAATVHGGGGVILLLSGGLSWGDPPSELFDSMSRLQEAGVLPDSRWTE
jgi:hypothetical protein